MAGRLAIQLLHFPLRHRKRDIGCDLDLQNHGVKEKFVALDVEEGAAQAFADAGVGRGVPDETSVFL